jgi:hypothetical protein
MDIAAALPVLLPSAIAWAEEESARALRAGEPLSREERDLALRAGVEFPERVRIRRVVSLPEPDEAMLRAAGRTAGLIDPRMIGLTLGYAVFVRRGHDARRALSHEFRHVRQYEQAGGIAAFLPIYLRQVLELGYEEAPLERDARAHETG